MKLHFLEIQNFRAIKNQEIDFTNHLSKPKKVTLLVGPNGSGKTSILDAIHLVVRTLENSEFPRLREGLEYSVQQLVRDTAKQVEITFTFSLEEEERKTLKDIFSLLNQTDAFPVESESNGVFTLKWQFPSSKEKRAFQITPNSKISNLLGGRGKLAEAISKNLVGSAFFERVGGVCYLDQRRSFQIVKNFSPQNGNKLSPDDVLSWLNVYFQKHQTWNEKKYGKSYWGRIQKLFNQVCKPVELLRVESGPDIDTIILSKNEEEYDLAQMSSGEQQVLRILVGLVAEAAFHSVVLIDEIEFHLHPNWQRKLVQALREDENDNQYIFTTHSSLVKELFYQDEIIELDAFRG